MIPTDHLYYRQLKTLPYTMVLGVLLCAICFTPIGTLVAAISGLLYNRWAWRYLYRLDPKYR